MNPMNLSCLGSTVQAAAAAAGGVMGEGIFSWHTLGHTIAVEHCLNVTVYLRIVTDHVRPFMAAVCSTF